MKIQQIQFKNPIKIIQVFRNINVYGKEEKSFELRKDKMTWKPIPSKSGYVLENELFLPEQILRNPDFNNCDLIILEDDNTIQSLSFLHKKESNYCFITTRPNQLDIFELRMKDALELHLKYGYFEIGTPERKNFKLFDIKQQQPVEIRINGKTDASLSSRRARVFKEQYYVIEYIGDFSQCKLLKEPFDAVVKMVPEERKIIDLIKPLW
ncbi:MAG: hypothetical protein IT271_08320 [Chitinophagales bacterium]|nr:hypothetical protein [Chitinophagales bacterium]